MIQFLISPKSRLICGVLALSAALAPCAPAQTAAEPPSLRQAIDAAWQLSSQSRASVNRREELAAKEKATAGWIAGEPVVTLSHRTDVLTRNEGLREYEAEVEVPLWNSRVRTATQVELGAQRVGFDGQIELSKLKLAGELRALVGTLATAQVELDLNRRKLADAEALAQDLGRRVKAGENARVDLLQAQVLVQQAQVTAAQADTQLLRLQAQWRNLTGLTSVPALSETLARRDASGAQATLATPVSTDHPAMRLARAQVSGAEAKLALANADKRDPMSLAVGVTRERSNSTAPSATTLRFALRIPLGGDNRNAPRQAAARADLDAAMADADVVERQLPYELAVASAELSAAGATERAARERLRLSTDVQTLITKSWRLGESDLPTRLRADNEQFEASLSLARATVDVQRAISNLNQAHGLLP